MSYQTRISASDEFVATLKDILRLKEDEAARLVEAFDDYLQNHAFDEHYERYYHNRTPD